MHIFLFEAGSYIPQDFTQRWITNDNWTYTADLTPAVSALRDTSDPTLLVFYGLDTVANIVRFLNLNARSLTDSL